MKINVADINLAQGHPLETHTPSKKKFRLKTTSSDLYKGVPIVAQAGGAKYALYLGAAVLNIATQDGKKQIECAVLETLPDERGLKEMFLLEKYLCNTSSALTLGKLFRVHRDEYGLNQLQFSRRLGISPGTVHHYESLAVRLDENLGEELENGRLRFKEARCIADLDSHARQRAVAQPFIDGRLSSVQVEKLVGVTRTLHDTPASKIVAKFIELVAAEGAGVTSEQVVREIQFANNNPLEEPLENRIFKLAGELADLTLQKIPEVKRLKYISSMRVLDSRLQMALATLYGSDKMIKATEQSAHKRVEV